MDEREHDEQRTTGTAIGRRRISDEVRASAIGLLIAGGLCLYFGFTLAANAPPDATPEEAARWFAVDEALNWGLRIVGILFLAVAGLAMTGARAALLGAALCEGLFALVMVAMAIEWSVDAHVFGGGWDPAVIIVALLAIISVGQAMRAWTLYRQSAPAPDDSHASPE